MSNDCATEKELIKKVAATHAKNTLKTQYSSEKEGRLKTELKKRITILKAREIGKIW